MSRTEARRRAIDECQSALDELRARVVSDLNQSLSEVDALRAELASIRQQNEHQS